MAAFSLIQTEFFARGYDYLNDAGAGLARAKRWINEAYLELCEEERWPFLMATATGASPLAIADLREVAIVTDTGRSNQLHPMPEDELTDYYISLTTVGVPLYYYLTDTTVNVYPTGGTLSVRYWKVPVALSAAGDIPVIPDRFTNLIIDGAVRRAANTYDAAEDAAAAEAERQRGLDIMRRSLLFRSGPPRYQRIAADSSADW